jgi:TatD DNase family protein
MNTFYDTHAHLDFPDFAADLPQVLERAVAAGIARVITIGTDFDSSRRAIALAEAHPQIDAVVGWHPSHVSAAPDDIRAGLRTLAQHPKVVALGETGLDYHRLPPGNAEAQTRYRERQAALFAQHLDVARELGLNCVIHQRDAFADVLRILDQQGRGIRGVFHCFGGSPAEAQQVLATGSIVSFTGVVTFKNAAVVRETVAALAPDQFMLETDCPYLAPVPFRGKRCEPAHVAEIARVVAEVRGCTLEALSDTTCRTAERFFARSPAPARGGIASTSSTAEAGCG